MGSQTDFNNFVPQFYIVPQVLVPVYWVPHVYALPEADQLTQISATKSKGISKQKLGKKVFSYKSVQKFFDTQGCVHNKYWDVEQQFFYLDLLKDKDIKNIDWGNIADKMSSQFKIERTAKSCLDNFRNVWCDILPNSFYSNGIVKVLIFKNKINVFEKSMNGLWKLYAKKRRLTRSLKNIPKAKKHSQTKKRNLNQTSHTVSKMSNKRLCLDAKTQTNLVPPTPTQSVELKAPVSINNEDCPFLNDLDLPGLNFDIFDLQFPASPEQSPYCSENV